MVAVGVRVFGESVRPGGGLCRRWRADNNLGHRGMASLKEALMVNTSVTNLNVAADELDQAGLTA
eukprot:3793869-Pleurochrysis_carterae.AAC.1